MKQEAERAELERAVELLGRTTRPGRFLVYLGTKFFQHPEQHLSEFNIATEVFGRSEKNFDPTADAVVRVEAHRLRKKLRDIYEKDDRTQGLQISLPPGTYVLKFTPSEQAAGETAGKQRAAPRWWIPAVLAAIVLAIVGVVLFDRSQGVQLATSPSPPAAESRPSANAASGQQTE